MLLEKQNLRKGSEAGNRVACGLTSNANIKGKMAKYLLVEKGTGLSSQPGEEKSHSALHYLGPSIAAKGGE